MRAQAEGVSIRVVSAIARRDLKAALRAPGVLAPMIILPVVFSVVLPLVAFAVSRSEDQIPLDSFIDLLPEVELSGGESASAQVAVALARFVLPTLLVVVPLMVVSVIASDSIAGENERGTLEWLLLTPASNREIFLGKVLSALVPAIAVHLLASTVYVFAVNVLLGDQVTGLVLPTRVWFGLIWLVGPSFAIATLGLTVVVSARSQSVAAANQISAISVLPIVAMVVGQVSGVALLSGWLLVLVGLVLFVAALGFMRLGSRALNRNRLVEQLQ